MPGVMSSQGDYKENIVSVSACTQMCNSDYTCLAFDFNIYNQCFLHKAGYEDRVYLVTGVDQYRVKLSCLRR